MLYISALVTFFILHIIPLNKNARKIACDSFGEKRYRLLFRLSILSCVAMGVYGWNDFPAIYFYEPSVFMKQIHLAIMLPTVYLWIAAEVPNNLKRYIRNPMLTGMKLWALGHLLANGDLRSMILFISFLIFSVIAVIVSNKREVVAIKATPLSYDVRVVMASLLVYCTIAYFHGNLFGMPVAHYFAVS